MLTGKAVVLALSVVVLVRGQNCNLQVPADPLTPQGLATPYLLSPSTPMDTCDEASAGSAAFVEGAILNAVTGEISVYNPLVITQGTTPAVNPAVPVLPTDSIVALWFGFNGGVLTLVDTPGASGRTKAHCFNGNPTIPGDRFGQFAFCNAESFFIGALAAILERKLVIPAIGLASDGMPCPTTRDFSVVDQDQSDNVISAYLVSNGRLAQNTAANRARLNNTAPQVNGSDNRLLTAFILPALNCQRWMVRDLADPGNAVGALALDELQAAAKQGAPVALVPAGDPMVLVDGNVNLAKINAYRQGVAQPPAFILQQASTLTYCQRLASTGSTRILANRARFMAAPSPDPNMNLFQFLVQRFGVTMGPAIQGGLGCTTLGVTNPLAALVGAGGTNAEKIENMDRHVEGFSSTALVAITVCALTVVGIVAGFVYRKRTKPSPQTHDPNSTAAEFTRLA